MTGRLIRLALQSRRRLIRDALSAYFDNLPEFDVVGQTAGLAALPELCALRRPDVAVAEVGRLTAESVEQLRGLRSAAPNTEIVLSYGSASPPVLDAAAAAGVTALVPTSRGLDMLLRVVRRQANPARRQAGPVRRRRGDGSPLSDREVQVASLLAAGHNVPQMADRMGISSRTVENHKRRLYAKLGVGTSSHAVSRATALGLIEPADGGPRPFGIEAGRAPLVVAHGRPGPCLDAVALGVLGSGLPLLLSTPAGGGAGPDGRDPVVPGGDLGRDHWLRWQRGPLAVVLVDPGPADWSVPASLHAPLIVVHSTGPDLSDVAAALMHGAQALVRGAEARDDIVALLPLVRLGYFAMDSAHISDLAGWLTAKVADRSSGVPVLTARERDILDSIANGDTVRQTARSLGIAEKTVESTQARLLLKFGARNRSEALTIGYRLGLVNPPETGGDRAVAQG
jgi:two-component system nitrate/nitrite response regulator NarL